MTPKQTVVVPFLHPPDRVAPMTQVRSTLLSASLRVVHQMGWQERYFAALPKELHEEMQLLTAGVWVRLPLAIEHYRACDGMYLTSTEMDAIGEDVSLRTQGSFVGTLSRAATGAGLTPWHFLKNVHRVWGRMVVGGDTAVYEVGPKEALVLYVGCPLVEILYFRVAMLAYHRALVRTLSRVVYTREMKEHRKKEGIGFRLSWV